MSKNASAREEPNSFELFRAPKVFETKSQRTPKNFLLRRISSLPHSEDFRCKSRVRLFDCGISQKNIFSIEYKPRSNTDKHRCFSKQKKLAPLQAREANRTFQSNFRVLRLFLRFADILQNPVGVWFILPSTLTHIAGKGVDLLY